MKVQKNALAITIEGVSFRPGHFRLVVPYKEMEAVEQGSCSDKVMVELFRLAALKREESNCWVGYFQAETPGWTPVLNAAAMHKERLTVDQFAVLSHVIRKDRFELRGEPAHFFISRLWELTPGARLGSIKFPKPADEMESVQLVKFFDEDYGKTSLHFRFPTEELIGQMIGREGRNRKHLSKILGEGAGVYPFINPEVMTLPVTQSLEPSGQVA